MQEDKELFLDATDTVFTCLTVMTEMLATMRVNQENMMQAVKKVFSMRLR